VLRRVHDMGLVRKFALLFAITGLIVGSLSFVALGRILSPAFEEIEQRVNAEQLARANFSLSEFNDAIYSNVYDYAVWDDVFEYVKHPSAQFEQEIYTPLGFKNLDADMMGVVRFDGKVLFFQVSDNEAQRFLPEQTVQLVGQISQGRFAQTAIAKERASTYIRSGNNIYAVQSAWILKSDGSGTPEAYHVMGNRLNAENLSEALQTKVKLDLAASPNDLKALLASPAKAHSEPGPNSIVNRIALVDIHGKAQAIATFNTPRSITAAGNQAIAWAIAAMGLALVILMLALGGGISRISVTRLAALRGYIRKFRKSSEAMPQHLLESGDEIGVLARQFDELTQELAEAEEELRQKSYVQGKADSAVGLLHNVRNALGPLQVKYDKWQQEDRQPYRKQIRMALDELANPDCAGQRRADLEAFVAAASRKLAEMGDARAEEISSIKGSIDQILGILSDYDFDSSAKPQSEAVDLRSILVREWQQLKTLAGQEIALALPSELPEVWGNHIHLAQIVGNLFRNAYEAMVAAGVEDMRLTVEVRRNRSNTALEIAIADNGEGATPEVLAQAFERGFSTRSGKSGGMGLHWSANAARAMGGQLALQSTGLGSGATVRLRLPLAPHAAGVEAQALAA
jgi:signal transduction histidine kinase